MLLPVAAMHAADTDSAAVEAAESATAPVILDGETLMVVSGFSAYPADVRAERAARRIRAVAADSAISPEAVLLREDGDLSRIVVGDQTLMVVVDADAQRESTNRSVLAQAFQMRITEAIRDYRRDRSAASLAHSGLLALIATVAFIVLFWIGLRFMRWLNVFLERRVKRRLRGLEEQSLRIVNATHLWRLLSGLRSVTWTVAILIAIVAYLDFLLQLFPWTRGFGYQLLALLTDPLRTIGQGMLAAIPKLLILAIIFAVMRYVLKALVLLFSAVARGSLKIEAFEPEWALPTYRLVRLLVIALTIVIAYPYIPGSQSEVFKGVSIFFGVIFSLGSSSLIGNIIAGYSLTYRRAFRIGDRVSIGEHTGDVMEMRLLVTHVRTPKNEEIIIPNSEILNNSVVNYSTFAREGKLILHTTVGIGYETPWRQVEAMLLEAAARTEGLMREPPPYVLQKALADFAITYEINVYYNDALTMGLAYTRLHASILDVFNEYGIQIMTPAYEGDPEVPKIVPKEQWYTAPAATPETSTPIPP
jgi:small-conductance mechanosensitive channel